MIMVGVVSLERPFPMIMVSVVPLERPSSDFYVYQNATWFPAAKWYDLASYWVPQQVFDPLLNSFSYPLFFFKGKEKMSLLHTLLHCVS